MLLFNSYCNSRILKFSASGKLLTKWGQPSYANQGMMNSDSLTVYYPVEGCSNF